MRYPQVINVIVDSIAGPVPPHPPSFAWVPPSPRRGEDKYFRAGSTGRLATTISLSPVERGRGPLREQWEGEGDQVIQLQDRFPLTPPSFAWVPPSPRRGEERQLRFSHEWKGPRSIV